MTGILKGLSVTPRLKTIPLEGLGERPSSGAEARVCQSLEWAWDRIALANVPVRTVEWITTEHKRRKRRPVLRLRIAGAEHAVIAKRQPNAEAMREAHVYGCVLPRINLDTVVVHGLVDDPIAPGQSWLFMDETGEDYCPDLASHRRAAASWLARLHLQSTGRTDDGLPSVGACYHESLLRRARQCVADCICSPENSGNLASVGHRLIESMDTLLAQWYWLASVCAHLPVVLVHGSVRGPNFRMTRRHGLRLQAIDWSSAGWGPPCRDLHKLTGASVGARLDDYWRLIRGRGLYRDRLQLETAWSLGGIFRLVEHMSWDIDALAWEIPDHQVPRLELRLSHLNGSSTWLTTAIQRGA